MMKVKKLISLLILGSVLIGCQPQKTDTLDILKISEKYNVQDKIEFEIVKSEVSHQIAPTNKNKTYQYIRSEDKKIFIDLIVQTTNHMDKEIVLKDIYSGSYTVNKETYDLKTAMETSDYTQITSTDTLKSNQSRYIHLYCQILEEQLKEEATITLKVLDDKEYSYTFSTEDIIENNDIKSIGDTLSLKNADIVFKQILQTKKIEPSKKGFFYSYIPVENDDETFIAIEIELKNISDTKIDPSEYLYCEYQTKDQQVTSQIIMESENNKSLTKTGNIESSNTRILYLAMPVKDSLLNEKGIVQLFVEGKTYEIQF